MKTDQLSPKESQSILGNIASIQRFRKTSRALNRKLQRATNSNTDDSIYNRRTVGIWKTKNGQRHYINLKGEELLGAEARYAAETDKNAKINRSASVTEGYFEEDATSLRYWRIPKEILQVYSAKGIQNLYDWQAEALSQPGVADGTRNFIFFTPTSSGKSLIAELLLIRHLIFQQKKCIIILPFVSLVEEKLSDLQSKLYPIGCTCKGFHSNIAPVLTEEVDVAICTIEKASLMLNSLITSRRLNLVTAVIIDELHYIGDPQRGHLLEAVLSKILLVKRSLALSLQIVGMSATLPNYIKVAEWLDAVYYCSEYRPVPLSQNFVIKNVVYNEKQQQWRSFPSNMDNTAITVSLVQEVLQARHSAIVFVATKAWCVNLMLTLAQRLNPDDDARRAELLESMRIEMQGPICPKLEFGILKGVAYHNSDLPMPLRRLIETGFRSRVINCLCATSTIAAGVNLPARRVIFRSQYVGRQHLSVSQYQQMAGRAGRANLDDLGESYLICEGSSQDVFSKAQMMISAPASPVCSNLIVQDDSEKMIRFILDGICLNLCNDQTSVQLFISCTLWAANNNFCENELLAVAAKSTMYLVENKFIHISGDRYIASNLGQATSACGFSCSDAISAFESLSQARLRLCTASPLQLAFLSTPLQSPFSLSNNLALQQKTMEHLNSVEQDIATAIGVDPFFTFKSIGVTLQLDSVKDAPMQRYRRLILAKLLCELINRNGTLSSLCAKFNVTPGDLQNLQTLSATMANMSSVFCQHLRWENLALLLARFAQLLSFGCTDNLLPLFAIPKMTVFWANALYNNQLQTPEDIAASDFEDFVAVLTRMSSETKYLTEDYIRATALSFYEASLAIREHRQLDPTA